MEDTEKNNELAPCADSDEWLGGDLQETIASLKQVKKEQGLSIEEIESMVAATGTTLHKSTLYKVFADGSETVSFSYKRTIQPLARALLVNNRSTEETVVRAQLDTYLHICEYKMEIIDSLHKQIDHLKSELIRRSEEYDRRVAFLRDQIELKDTRMDRKDETIEKLLDQILLCKRCAFSRDEEEQG